MGTYEENIIPIKISQLAEHVAKVKRVSLDDALVYIYVNPMYERLYDEEAKWWYLIQKHFTKNLNHGVNACLVIYPKKFLDFTLTVWKTMPLANA